MATESAYIDNYPSPVSVSAGINFEYESNGNYEAPVISGSFNQERNKIDFPQIHSHPTGFENHLREYTPIHEPNQE